MMIDLSDYSVSEFRRRISVTRAMQARARHQSNLWVFDSPKIGRRFTVAGDVAFMHIVLLEGDVDVVEYEPEPKPVMSMSGGEPYETTLDAIVSFRGGREEWWEFKRKSDAKASRTGRSRNQLDAQAEAAASAGRSYRTLTEEDLEGKEILFNNWLSLCAAITRCRGRPRFREAEILCRRMSTGHSFRLDELMQRNDVDPAIMLASIAELLQKDELRTDLADSSFCRSSILSWRST
ncbi:hypothetical protein RI103_34720 [Paraburkholderia sp. FT54]|uniref:hypothetical protein n=1 Tax=Paraburkholderia sp. FT54 TaxID=3074437 RepID=UPI0028779660|nr:hypothetical protein [Paraburkholderia sp. FT54]WNC95031.1 hypothetical protein RI103_34720 [Paraburkholderia sp. FT54]